MTENEALEKHKKDCRRCIDKSCMYGVDCLQKKDIEVYEELQQYRAIGTVEEIRSMIRKSDFSQKPSREELISELKELSKMKMMLECYEEIGTIEECRNAYAYGYNQGGIDRAEELQKCREYGYNKAIDEAIKTSANAICVGCGYLEGHKCNYKGANCGVSKPMLETVVGALERLKGGADNG